MQVVHPELITDLVILSSLSWLMSIKYSETFLVQTLYQGMDS